MTSPRAMAKPSKRRDGAQHTMDGLISRMVQLHSSPHVAWKVLNLLQTDEFETRQLVTCLQSDPALTAAILQTVNSSYYGLLRKIASLDEALVYIGSRTLRLLVLGFGLLDCLTRDSPAKMYQEFWRRSLTMAAAAAHLNQLKDDVSQEAYTAGLLADVGTLVFAQVETETYIPLYERHAHGPNLVEAERQQFGCDHAELGARLLSRWNLPSALTSAVAQHHQAEPLESDLDETVRAAGLLAEVLWAPQSDRLPEVQQLLSDRFTLDLDAFINLTLDCKNRVTQYAKLFHVELSDSIDCNALLLKARQLYEKEALKATMDLDGMTSIVDRHPTE